MHCDPADLLHAPELKQSKSDSSMTLRGQPQSVSTRSKVTQKGSSINFDVVLGHVGVDPQEFIEVALGHFLGWSEALQSLGGQPTHKSFVELHAFFGCLACWKSMGLCSELRNILLASADLPHAVSQCCIRPAHTSRVDTSNRE